MSTPPKTPDILAKIVADKQAWLRANPVYQRSADLPVPAARISLPQALSDATTLNVIAEVKRKSPSAGAIATIADPADKAELYQQAGARAISVLTDEAYFGGRMQDLEDVAGVVNIPLLRKDFVIESRQIHEAKSAGASIVLLIAAILEPQQAWEFHCQAKELGLDTIFEIHSEQEYEAFARYKWPVIGINNRNLHTFTTDIGTTELLAPQMPSEAVLISESGFHETQDFARVFDLVHGFLVGESLSAAADPGQKLQKWQTELLG